MFHSKGYNAGWDAIEMVANLAGQLQGNPDNLLAPVELLVVSQYCASHIAFRLCRELKPNEAAKLFFRLDNRLGRDFGYALTDLNWSSTSLADIRGLASLSIANADEPEEAIEDFYDSFARSHVLMGKVGFVSVTANLTRHLDRTLAAAGF